MNTNKSVNENNSYQTASVPKSDYDLLCKADAIHDIDSENLRLIRNLCGDDYIYRQLAEECAELVQAALKMIRVLNDETPDDPDKVLDNYVEELADTWVMLSTAMLNLSDEAMQQCSDIADFKRERLHNRLCAAENDAKRHGSAADKQEVGSKEKPSEGHFGDIDEDFCKGCKGCAGCDAKDDENDDENDDEGNIDDMWDELDEAWAGMDEALTQITAEHMEQKQQKQQQRDKANKAANKDDWKEVMNFVRRVCDGNRAAADRLRTVLDRE